MSSGLLVGHSENFEDHHIEVNICNGRLLLFADTQFSNGQQKISRLVNKKLTLYVGDFLFIYFVFFSTKHMYMVEVVCFDPSIQQHLGSLQD